MKAVNTILEPQIQMNVAHLGEANPTVYIQEGELYINQDRPGYQFCRVGTRHKHVFLDKLVRALLLYQQRVDMGSRNPIVSAETYDEQADNIWNNLVDKYT
jgi:hypothetical protein